jgi:hypothetical protein
LAELRNAIQSGAIVVVEIDDILIGRIGVDERHEEDAFNLDDYMYLLLGDR